MRASAASISTVVISLRMYNETLRNVLVSDVASPKKLDRQHAAAVGSIASE